MSTDNMAAFITHDARITRIGLDNVGNQDAIKQPSKMLKKMRKKG